MSKVFNRIFVATLGIITLIAISAASAVDSDRFSVVNDPTGFSILEAGEKGMFNMGPAMGDVISEPETIANKEVLKFDYTIFGGAIVGVWTKIFPNDSFKMQVLPLLIMSLSKEANGIIMQQ